MNRPCFNGKPISTVSALAWTLHIPERQLIWVTDRGSQLYHPLPPEIKPDGSVRQVYNPAKSLKTIQRSINRHIFRRVYYPPYLQGGIRDRNNPRDCKSNARLHAGSRLVINEDVSGFFPSVTKQQIHDIWQYFFCFPPAVATVLTELTAYQDKLPQGAPTSSYLANLVLWKHEPWLVDKLASEGIRYSRYIDDITLSSTGFQGNASKTSAVKSIKSMCSRNGFRVKKRKHRIESSGQAMSVNNLLINSGVTLPKKERARIRAAVKACELYETSRRTTDQYQTLLNSTIGRAVRLRQYHPQEGDALLKRLSVCEKTNL